MAERERFRFPTIYPGNIMIRLIALAAFLAPVVFAQQQLTDWLSDYREALKVAKQTKKPILLEFRCEA
jgi:hypothetical protein